MEREALTLDTLPAAMAAKNSRGLVIAQVERIAAGGLARSAPGAGAGHPGRLRGAGRAGKPLADLRHARTTAPFPARSRVPLDRIAPLPLDERKIIARRAATGAAAGRRGQSRHRHAGGRGGGRRRGEGAALRDADRRARHHRRHAAGRPRFRRGAQPGSGDPAEPAVRFLRRRRARSGRASAWRRPTARATSTSAGSAAGWPAPAASSTSARTRARLVFAGTFTAGGLVIAIEDGKLRIVHEGRSRKFIDRVEQITFSGSFAAESGQPVLYVTERCVFRRTAGGRGADRGRAGHRHRARHPRAYGLPPDRARPGADGRAHVPPGADGARADPARPVARRPHQLRCGAEHRCSSTSKASRSAPTDDVELVRREVETRCRAIGHKVALIVNYDGFTLDPAVSDAYFSMITYLQQRYYTTASRYTTSAFMRLKLGAGLTDRELMPHVFETASEAHASAPLANRNRLHSPEWTATQHSHPSRPFTTYRRTERARTSASPSAASTGIAYVEWGDPASNRVAICVHGLSRQGRDFDRLAAGWQVGWRVVCPDLAGRGQSDWLRRSQNTPSRNTQSISRRCSPD